MKVIGRLGQLMYGLGKGSVTLTVKIAVVVFVSLFILKLAGIANVGWFTVVVPILLELGLVVFGLIGILLIAIADV